MVNSSNLKSYNSFTKDYINKKNVILILGMHRSGTSLLARLINIAGIYIPSKIIGATKDNETGHWEPVILNDIDQQLLIDLGSDWFDWGKLNFDAASFKHIIRKYQEDLRSWLASEVVEDANLLLKEPRLCRLTQLLWPVIEADGLTVKVVIPYRNPLEVAQSLHKRDQLELRHGVLLWLRHVLEAERNSRHVPRSFVNYAALLANWQVEMARIFNDLNLSDSVHLDGIVQSVEQYIQPTLRHHARTSDDLSKTDYTAGLALTLFKALLKFSVDPYDKTALITCDQVYARFEEIEQLTLPLIRSKDVDLVQARVDLQTVQSQLNRAKAELTEIRSTLQEVHERHLIELANSRDLLHSAYERHQTDLAAFRASTSWRVTAPLRSLGERVRMLRSKGRRVAAAIIRPIWQRLPIAQSRKEELRNTLFSLCGCIFSFSGSYRAWKAARHCSEATTNSSDAFANDGLPATAADGQVLLDEQAPFVEKRIPCDLEHPKARLIAFYLPQFHTIPENDQWWGEGFTEWTNVRPAKPKFPGHYQPHEPVELGYYNLLDTETQVKQIALAKRYGIGGFCFYWYWFAGKRLLEKPVENWLNTPELDFPFCLCWANENWSRRWDGGDNELLMSQEHSPEDDLAFIAELAPYLMDRRYIRINGKPLIILYRPRLLPEPVETAGRWRSWCRENGIGEIYLAYTQSFEREDPGVYGFDAAIEFPPNIYAPKNLAERIPNLSDDFCGTIYDWRFYFARSYAYQRYPYTLFRCVCPSWDNTARSNNNSRILVNSTPADYRIWLENAISRTVTDATTPDERIIFCNAWNEWAEGAHLEPDTKYGYAFLDASRAALNSSERPAEVLLVGHDANPDGAQLLLLNLARSYSRNGMRVCILLLEGGQLLDEYQRVARVTVLKKAKGRDSEILHILRRLRSEHDQIAVVNTLASGVLLPQLKKTGYRCLSLVHEMTSASDKVCLEPAMHAIAEYADVVVFPTQVVRKQFEARLGRDLLPGKILPQELPQKPLPSAKGADPLQASCGSRETDFTCYTMDLLRLSGRVMPRVSVLVPNYNYGRYIEARLQSIQAQEYPIYEIIVLDDCSTDDSLARIHAFAATCARPLRIVENSENSGNVFRQWAKGIDMVRGDVVWIAEADDLAKPDFLSTVMRAFEDPATVLSYCDSIQVDEDDQVLATDYRYYTDPVSTTHWAEHYINPGEDEIARALYVKNTIPSVSGVVMATTPLREILAEHRSHLENVRFVGDWLVYLWLAERGAIAYNTASKNIHRRHHQNSVTLSSFGAAQLAEIKAVQEEVITRHRLGREQQDKAAAYLAELAAQFGLTAAEH